MKCTIGWAPSIMVAVLASTAAFGQNAASYPNRPIRIIVTYPPGGPADIIARSVGQKLTEAWGQPVVIDNRAGAGGLIGTDLAAKSAPDGYTLLVSNFGPFAISPFVYSKLSYDPVRDLTPITLAATSWFFLVTNPAVPVTSVKELIALAKAKPAQIAFASAGNASPSHLAAALFQSSAGIQLIHVPYKGGAPSVGAVIGGEVQMAIESPPPIVPQVKAGKLRALAITGEQRSSAAPDVPTMGEAGYPKVVFILWVGLLAPAGTPADIIAKLHAESVKAAQSREVRERLASEGADPYTTSTAQMTEIMRDETAKWLTVIKAANISLE